MDLIRRFCSGIRRYFSQLRWYDLGLIKLCLCAAGVLIGLAVPSKARKLAACCAVTVFFATYAPIMLKFFRTLLLDEE